MLSTNDSHCMLNQSAEEKNLDKFKLTSITHYKIETIDKKEEDQQWLRAILGLSTGKVLLVDNSFGIYILNPENNTLMQTNINFHKKVSEVSVDCFSSTVLKELPNGWVTCSYSIVDSHFSISVFDPLSNSITPLTDMEKRKIDITSITKINNDEFVCHGTNYLYVYKSNQLQKPFLKTKISIHTKDRISSPAILQNGQYFAIITAPYPFREVKWNAHIRVFERTKKGLVTKGKPYLLENRPFCLSGLASDGDRRLVILGSYDHISFWELDSNGMLNKIGKDSYTPYYHSSGTLYPSPDPNIKFYLSIDDFNHFPCAEWFDFRIKEDESINQTLEIMDQYYARGFLPTCLPDGEVVVSFPPEKEILIYQYAHNDKYLKDSIFNAIQDTLIFPTVISDLIRKYVYDSRENNTYTPTLFSAPQKQKEKATYIKPRSRFFGCL